MRLAVWLVAGGVLVAGNACATSVRFDVSVPVAVPEGGAGEVRGETIELRLENLVLQVQLQNYRGGGVGPALPLGLWLGFDTSDGGFALVPQEVTLTTADQITVAPLTYLGPAERWESPRAAGMGCGPRRYSWGWALSKIDVTLDDVRNGNSSVGVLPPSSGRVRFDGSGAFMFWFDIDPSPDGAYVLRLDGITRANVAIPVPGIAFIPGSVNKHFPTP